MDNKNDFTKGNILSKLIKFMLPILGALILQAAYSAVDIAVVGHFGTNEGISGVSIGGNVINFVVFTIAGLSTGLMVSIGKYLGQKQNERIGKAIGSGICLFSVIAVVATVLLLVLAPTFASWMQTPSESMKETIQYIRICGGGIFFIIAYNLLSSIFRGLGDSKMPLLFVGIACCVNIVLDLVLVAGFNLNVVGAALATVFAQAISVVLSIIIILRKKDLPFKMVKSDISFNSEIKVILNIGTPMALQEVLTQISFLALCAFVNTLGLEASSGYGVAQKIVSFVMLIPSSLMQSMSSFVAQNVGAGQEKRSQHAMLCGMGLGASLGLVVGLCAFFFGNYLSMIFSNDANVIAKSAEYLKGFALEAVVTSVLFSFIGYFSGHGKTLFVMIQGISQTFIVRLPMSYIMSVRPNANLTGIGLAAPTATIFGILINLVYYIIYLKKMQKMNNNTSTVID